MIVSFGAAVGADYWSRADENTKIGVAVKNRFFQPIQLLLAPDGLVRTVFHIVR